MKKIKRLLAVLILSMVAFSAIGCSAVKNLTQKVDEAYIKRYVGAMLNCIYKNDNKEYLALKLGTAEDALKEHEKMIDAEVAGFMTESDVTDEKALEEWREIMNQLLAKTKYSIESATMREDESFLVVISYEQYKVFENILPPYLAEVRKNGASWYEEAKTEAEYNAKIMAVYRDYFRDIIEKPIYDESKKAEIVVKKNGEGLYQIDADTMNVIESLLVDVEFANEYVDSNVPEAGGVVLGEYKGISAKRDTVNITDEDVDSDIYYELSSYAEATDRTTAVKWDVLTIDFTGYMDGKLLEGGSGSNIELQLGSNTFIQGFEEGLIGAKVGDTVELNLKFPENYGEEELNGKDVTFKVTIRGLKAMPELTDEFIKKISGYETLAELREYIRASLVEDAEQEAEELFQKAILSQIIEASTFDGSLDEEISQYEKMYFNQYEEYAKYYNVTLTEFVNKSFGLTLEEFKKEVRNISEFNVKTDRVLNAVAEKECLTVADDEIEAVIQDIMEQGSYKTREAVLADYPLEDIKEGILQDKALELILGNAKVIK